MPIIPSGGGSVSASSITGTVSPANGGTGVANNASSTLTISGNFGTTLTVSGTTTATLQQTSGTLVGRSTTDTLTNKTIDADSNTITNIEDADIKAAAAIAVNKLAALTFNRAVVSDVSGFLTASATTDTEIGYLSGVTSAVQTQINALPSAASLNLACTGRLTTETGVPISTADRTSQGTIYYTPYKGKTIALYDGAAWAFFSFTSELSLALTATSGKNYDVFVYSNAGILTLELSAEWTNDTTRADALTLQDGIYVKSGATTRRYVGTFRASGSNVTADAKLTRYVWNYYNRVERFMAVQETTNSWSYTTETWRATNGSSANKVEYVVGLSEDPLSVISRSLASNTTGASAISSGIGIDSTSTNSALVNGQGCSNGVAGSSTSVYEGYPGLGYHAITWLEIGQNNGSGTNTFFGDNGGAISGIYQTGMTASLMG